MKKNILTSILLSFTSFLGFSQSLDKEKLNSYFDALEKSNRFMGSVAVSRNGEVIFTRSVGFADVETKTKANEKSRYRIGSITKTFTATLVMIGVENKKILLDQTLDNYFPDIKNAAKISIRNLLNHRSGIHNITDDASYLGYHTQPKTQTELLDLITKAGSDFEPDSKMAYSNSNYILLTFILEKSFGKPYHELLKEYITKPIGLADTYVGSKINLQNKETSSYTSGENWMKSTETDPAIPLGAGFIVSTATDLVKFLDALFAGKVLKAESLEQMKTLKDNFGFGLFQMPFYNKKGFGHNGGIDGFSSVAMHFPGDGVSYALTSNGTKVNNNDISIAVLSAVFNKPYSIPEFKKALELNSEDLDKYLGVYSSAAIPLKVTITKKDRTLMGQATGQGAIPLEATEKDKFSFSQAGVVLEFNPSEKTMLLKQGGGEYKFSKD
ncbi:serine hydrolase domain-containing protein [Desertivirga arenae]|uniref:serine hydrolase domain-containing protein n=1 Tax=Desertivirga arenae TaxID=2810309 RepID=UPI001A95F4D7|nr:serine hydrolase domain-containing protein [Pedobacter sp. SYSU D00823]